MARNFPHFGRGKERSVDADRSTDIVKLTAIDPVHQQLVFIASDTKRVPDDGVADEINILFKDKTLEERIGFVKTVDELRHPEQTEQKSS